MNGVKKVVLLGLVSASFAVAGDLWGYDVEKFGSLQVKTPGAVYCWSLEEEPSEDNDYLKDSPCYTQTGGWWFGYVYGDAKKDIEEGAVYDAFSDKDLKPEGAMQLANSEDGSAQNGSGFTSSAKGIAVRFELKPGIDEAPSGAGVGFNWRQKDKVDFGGAKVENISGEDGICLTYKAFGKTADDHGVWVELGWNEATYEYNTWVYELDESADWKKVDLSFEDDFKKSWNGAGPVKSVALEEAEALKFKVQNKGADPATVTFILGELGWFGTCTGITGGNNPTPIVAKNVVNAGKFSLTGRSLSFSVKTSVQIVSIQGVVVAQKNLDANQTLNLANLPAGVYFVRSAEHGIVQKIMLK